MDATPYLEDMESRIDPGIEEDLIGQWTAFADGRFKGGIFTPRRKRAAPPGLAWPKIGTNVNATLRDFDVMLVSQLSQGSKMLEKGDGGILCARSNFGTGILSSVFGAEIFIMDDAMDTLPTTKPLEGGAATMRALLKKGIPDIHSSLAGKTLEMGARFLEVKKKYPKIGRFLHLYHPDTQGPMDICELLWGSSLFIDIVDDPGLVKDMLALITETYILYMKEWLRLAPVEGKYAAHWALLHRGRIMLRDDSAMNLSPDMFAEFIAPYDQRLLDEFGGGAIHFCGKGDHYIAQAASMRGLYGINMSQPEYNDMEIIFRHTVDKGIKLLALPRDAAEKALAAGRDLRGCVHCW